MWQATLLCDKYVVCIYLLTALPVIDFTGVS